jgi:hypothetical protein
VGNNLTYAFGGNSFNASGTFGGTMVETSFKKNGTAVVSDVGQHPIWIYGGNPIGGFSLISRAAPGWTINVVGNGAAMLNRWPRCPPGMMSATQAVGLSIGLQPLLVEQG